MFSVARAALAWFVLIVSCFPIQADAKSAVIQPAASLKVDHISFDAPTLPPFEFSVFCIHYAKDCKARRNAFRYPRGIDLSTKRWHSLVDVNKKVNHTIIGQQKNGSILDENWSISPVRGDCTDFAVTKRHALLAEGWPPRVLLLAEVVTLWGEHHLVLVVRLHNVDLVLDNLTDAIRPWSDTRFHWVRVQSPINPIFWSTIVQRTV